MKEQEQESTSSEKNQPESKADTKLMARLDREMLITHC